MLKKTMTYQTVDGDTITEDFYFNLTKAELTEMELMEKGGLGAKLQKIIADGDAGDVIRTFKMILEKSYGVRSEDGKRFVKNHDLWTEFTQTEAYSDLFYLLATDAQAGADFINAVIPKELQGDLDKPAPGAQPTPKVFEEVHTNVFEKQQEKPLVDDVLAGMSDEQRAEMLERLQQH